MGRNAQQYVSVVFGSTNGNRHESVCARDPAYVSPQVGLDLLRDEPSSFFGREHTMNQTLSRHYVPGYIQSRLAALAGCEPPRWSQGALACCL
jgi:hypothetical protein